ncbi:MAG: indole-3-glycerol phosphate synthase TrpC [Actinomycetota bacterium]
MSYLDELIASTRLRVDETRARTTDHQLNAAMAAAPAVRSLRKALTGTELRLIAEIKRASPTAGEIAPGLDAAAAAEAYARGGASALSVLTEPEKFKGSLDDIRAARGAGVPVLRKDFIVDELQVRESRGAGADAILLIVRALGNELRALYESAEQHGMECLVEVFDENDVERALEIGAAIVGVNHRDLETFEVDPDRTLKLAPMIPDEVVLVGLSGVKSRDDVKRLADAGARAVLVGEALGRSGSPEATVRELLGAA